MGHSPSASETPPTATAAELRAWRRRAIAQANQHPSQDAASTETTEAAEIRAAGQAAGQTSDDTAEEAAIEVDWLLRERAQLRPSQLRRARDDQPLAIACSLNQLDQIWQRRLQERQPLQYLVGHTPWRDLELIVAPGVLIPRPETELLIDAVAQYLAGELVPGWPPPLVAPAAPGKAAQNPGRWADIGTGSGAIALGLASRFPQMQIHAVDSSAAALALAQVNVDRYSDRDQLRSRLQLHLGQWLEPLAPWRGQLAGLVSNPPYIPTAAIAQLQPEVRDHEPHLALDGGPDGLDAIRQLIQAGAAFLAPGGFWIVELMAGQAPQVEALLQAQGGYAKTGRIRDLAGIERFVWAIASASP